MPGFHLSVSTLGRSAGRSACAASAYRAAELVRDPRTGLVHDYRRKEGVEHNEILAPPVAPVWIRDRRRLWGEVELKEKRKDARTAREITVALPHELKPQERLVLLREWLREEVVGRGMVADLAVHRPSERGDHRNAHAHILLTTREVNADGFGKKVRDWDDVELVTGWRESWAAHANRALERAGHDTRVDHRSLRDQRQAAIERGDWSGALAADRIPTRHQGPAATAMLRRGESVDRSRDERRDQPGLASNRPTSDEARADGSGAVRRDRPVADDLARSLDRLHAAARGTAGLADRVREAVGRVLDRAREAFERARAALAAAIERVATSKPPVPQEATVRGAARTEERSGASPPASPPIGPQALPGSLPEPVRAEVERQGKRVAQLQAEIAATPLYEWSRSIMELGLVVAQQLARPDIAVAQHALLARLDDLLPRSVAASVDPSHPDWARRGAIEAEIDDIYGQLYDLRYGAGSRSSLGSLSYLRNPELERSLHEWHKAAGRGSPLTAEGLRRLGAEGAGVSALEKLTREVSPTLAPDRMRAALERLPALAALTPRRLR
jgi:hypothetical protein